MSQPSYGTTACRVLAIPEILELVFSFLDQRKDVAKTALVCRNWSEVALDNLWRDVDNIHRLFGLLAPIQPDEFSREDGFERPLEPVDWARFSRYARRVRALSSSNIEELLHGRVVFDEVARTRPTLNILPRLSKLSWVTEKSESMQLSLMFMHENIRHFTVALVPSDTYSLSIYLQEIALRMPALTHLDMRFRFPVRDIQEDLCKLFDSLPHLQTVVLPKFTLSAPVIERLSRCPKLRVIQFEFIPSQGAGDVSDVHNWFPVLKEGAFPELLDISVSVHLPHMIRFLSTEFFPANLTCLYVHVLYIVPPYQVQEYLEATAQSCQQLKQLYIDFVGDPSPLLFRTVLPSDDRIGWNTIRPILKLSKLIDFQIHWDSPFAISQGDLEDLAASLTRLEILDLNTEPLPTPEPPSLTLSALIPFARHCPKLRQLGLYINASDVDLDAASRELYATLPPVRFRSLEKLLMGLSRIVSEPRIALFLSEILPLGCTVSAGVSWPEGFNAMEAQTAEDGAVLVDMWTQAGHWYKRWTAVDNLMSLLIPVRMQERARRDELEREVEDLRVRCRLMEDRARVGVPQDGGCILL
ncbi:hypothetical protein C2E23DRAFT_833106 [Lenzites betulinus]|nr:hypothetical protein C2E23DRAFT_833106 [Lenzites betulinus]